MKDINGVLLLYYKPMYQNAYTIMEHVNAFEKYSRYKVWAINTRLGFLKELNDFRFSIIVIHNTSHGRIQDPELKQYLSYLEKNKMSYMVCFFQDEHNSYQEKRFQFINNLGINCIFTLLEPQYFKDTYLKYSKVKQVINNIPGYVSDELIDAAQKYSLPDKMRTIDIGYRGSQLPYYYGRGAQEKTEIAEKFLEKAKNLGFNLDIDTRLDARLYLDAWYKFLGNCKGQLAVEAGVSIFDIEGNIYREYQNFIHGDDKSQLPTTESTVSFEEVSRKLNFDRYEDKIFYRTISPRHFEAAAFRVCQILYEGKYSGILIPNVHYILLKKDFSNFDDVIKQFNDPYIRHKITENAYNDLIASGEYSYKKFIAKFDSVLFEAGLNPDTDEEMAEKISSQMRKAQKRRLQIIRLKETVNNYIIRLFHQFPPHYQRTMKKIITRFGINLDQWLRLFFQ